MMNRIPPNDRFQKSDWLKLLSSIAIPLIIGTFTVVIAIHQQKVAQLNREKDAAQAADLREKDFEILLAQRKENNELAQSQRIEDKELARLQRELHFNLTKEKLLQENELADKQRQLSISQHEHELQIAYENHRNEILLKDEREKENILLNFQRQLANLLLDYNSTFQDPYDRLRFVIQMKTRAALRLLNPARRTIVVHSLYQAKLFSEHWNESKSILYRTNVSGVQFGHPIDDYEYNSEMEYSYLGISEVDARYASFRQVFFYYQPSFDHSNLDSTDWTDAQLTDIHFRNHMSMNDARFLRSLCSNIRFEGISINRISFERNEQCRDCYFEETSMFAARLDHSNFLDTSFRSLSMADGSMYGGSFIRCLFRNVILDRVNLSRADLTRSGFYHVSMVNCSLSQTILLGTEFIDVDLSGCTGLTMKQIYHLNSQTDVVLPKDLPSE